MSGPTKTEGEHEFKVDILISGDEIRGYTAEETLTRAEPLAIVGDYAVGPSDGDDFVGLAGYSVADGQQVPILGDDCEVRVELAESVDAGAALTADGTGAFVQADDGGKKHAVANEGGGEGDFVEVYVTGTTGTGAI